jgi:hypothetical protein
MRHPIHLLEKTKTIDAGTGADGSNPRAPIKLF